MAVTINEWYEVSIEPDLSSAPWPPATSPPNQPIPGHVVDAMVTSASITVFCIDPTEPATFASAGGMFVMHSDLFATQSQLTDTNVLNADDSTFTFHARNSDGSWSSYDPNSGAFRHYTGSEVSDMEAFLA